MTKVIELGPVHLSPTLHAKKLIAQSMYQKGLHFIGASTLLEEKVGYRGVVLHLLCQGIEITLKGLLLFSNYDKYQPKLAKPIGHNLEKLVNVTLLEFGLKPLKKDTTTELRTLNSFYSKHLLRYGTTIDIIIDPNSIAYQHTLNRIAATIRLANSGFSLKPKNPQGA